MLVNLYLVEGLAGAEDVIDGAMDGALLEVMPASVVPQRVLQAVESAAVEGRLVAPDPGGHRLCHLVTVVGVVSILHANNPRSTYYMHRFGGRREYKFIFFSKIIKEYNYGEGDVLGEGEVGFGGEGRGLVNGAVSIGDDEGGQLPFAFDVDERLVFRNPDLLYVVAGFHVDRRPYSVVRGYVVDGRLDGLEAVSNR